MWEQHQQMTIVFTKTSRTGEIKVMLVTIRFCFVNFKWFMIMHCWFIMRIKPTSAYENMWVYSTIDLVSHLHVSATHCGHLQGDIFQIMYCKEHQNQFTHIKY